MPILTVSSSDYKLVNKCTPSVNMISSSTCKGKLLEPEQYSSSDHSDYCLVYSAARLSMVSQCIVSYVVGFIMYKLRNSLQCETCGDALNSLEDYEQNFLIKMKRKGALICPSRDVIDVCLSCEKSFQLTVECHESNVIFVSCY